ncbi:MAG: hypothetical protein KJ882_00830, partial [Proteobacteria bacterium]|nr:hypothetical protein [Pseudomonadota bacterium]
ETILLGLNNTFRMTNGIYSYIIESQFQNVPFWPISALGKNYNPRNTLCIPAVKIFARLDLDQTKTF